ncbi:MAG: prepilin-type N-terminal cleavage/methylation domain-containing protein [Acidobacteriota bacterium]
MQILRSKNEGFSLIELMIGMTVTLILLGVISSIVFRSTSVRARESRKADALVSAQAALNVMTREIANSGFGLFTDSVSQIPSNGLIIADSNTNRIRLRSNFENVGDYSPPTNGTVINTNDPGEDITYFFDNATKSIVRYDAYGPDGPETSVVVNKISNVTFSYFNYTSSSSTVTETSTPTSATGRVRLTVVVELDPVVGQPDNQVVTFTSDVTLRNSNYMLRQY